MGQSYSISGKKLIGKDMLSKLRREIALARKEGAHRLYLQDMDVHLLDRRVLEILINAGFSLEGVDSTITKKNLDMLKTFLDRAAVQHKKVGLQKSSPFKSMAYMHARSQSADEFAMSLKNTLADIQKKGAISFGEIASELDKRRITTPSGKRWQRTTVKRVMERIHRIEKQKFTGGKQLDLFS